MAQPKRTKGKAEVTKKAEALKVLKVTYEDIASISPNPYNPNKQDEHDFELLLRSMTEDGFTQPILVQKSTRQIIDGEHRWRAAQQLGYEELPVVFTEMDPGQMRVATLRHNRARGEEDIELTAQVLKDLEKLGMLDYAQEELMMDDLEVQRMLEDVAASVEFAAEEFGQAWIPADGDSTEERVVDGEEQTVAKSAVAEQTMRQKKEKLDDARNAEEKAMISQEHKTAKMTFVVCSS